MANPRIEVEIGANVAGLTAGVNTATGQLDKLGKAAQTTAPQVQKLAQATQGYNSVGIDFARIVQDAPFGIIGIGNNITQLAQSFQTLKNTTGSTSAALKQSFASIFSSGNALILGISVLTTAFTILQQKGFFKTEDAAKSLNEQLDEYRENLDAISQASIKGQANAAKEIQNFKLLQIQAENTNIPLKTRIEAVQELQKNYPAYLGNLTQEQILNGNVGESYQLLAQNIISKAKAQAFSNAISENALKIATFENQIIEKQVELEKARAAALSASNNTSTGGGIGQPIFSEKAIAEAKVRDILKEQENIRNQIAKVQKEDENLTQRIVDLTTQGAVFTKEKNTLLKDNNKEKEKELKLEDELIAQTELGNQLRNDAFKKLQTITSELAPSLGKLQEIDLSKIQIAPEIADIDDSKLTAFVLRLAQFNSEVAGVIEGGAQQTIGDFAFAIGDALASGGNVVKAAGAALLGGLAGVLNQLGQLAIGTGLAIAGIKKALQTLNPAVAIGAGVALIALAGFVSSKAKSLGGSSGGSGGASGGGGSSVGSSGVGGGTAFTGGGAQGGLFEQNRDVSGEFVVRGQDLVYVLGQANNRINKG
jgi:hypothetical protein